MRIIVFGASGHVGGHFVRLANQNSHWITAIVRKNATSSSPAGKAPYASPAGVNVVYGEVLDPAFVSSVVAGHDAVVSCVGMRYKHPFAKRDSPDDFTSNATKNIIAAMHQHYLSRLSVVSAGGAGDSLSGLNLPMRIMLKISNLKQAYADINVAEAALQASQLDWQAVRPVTLTHKPRTDKVRIVKRYSAMATIPREDVAAFMLKELEAPVFTQRTPMIAA